MSNQDDYDYKAEQAKAEYAAEYPILVGYCSDDWHRETGEPYQCPSCGYRMSEGVLPESQEEVKTDSALTLRDRIAAALASEREVNLEGNGYDRDDLRALADAVIAEMEKDVTDFWWDTRRTDRAEG